MKSFKIRLTVIVEAPDKDEALGSFIETLILNPGELNEDKNIRITEVN
jgi:hypothetical protein